MMVAFYGLCVACMLVMKLAPLTPLGLWLNRHLVAEPLAHLADVKRHHLIFIALVVLMAMAGGELIAIYGPMAPAFALDLSIYLDAVTVTLALALATRVRSIVQVVRGRLAFRRGPRRAARPRRTRADRKPQAKTANDDDPAGMPLAA